MLHRIVMPSGWFFLMALCASTWSAMQANRTGNVAEAGAHINTTLKRLSAWAVTTNPARVTKAAAAVRTHIRALTRKNTVSRAYDGAADEKRDSVLNLEHGSYERNKMAAPPWVVPGTP
ncbi:hypothetical protein [Cronobacter dublinensis]|uniref:hypothetical protein n=1 Tax=Cronobacter dublinensis TaxID=413497 RepID=UPI001F4727C0|nr:hypothetical protein [Cronobacter dublinensis]